MDGVFGGAAAPFSAVAAVHLGSLVEHTRGCFLRGEKERAGFSELLVLGGPGGSGDVTFMSRQVVGLWVGLGV